MKNQSKIRLPRFISDGMILQRSTQAKIWGWAPAGDKITIRFLEEIYQADADSEGKWQVCISTGNAGGPYDMVLEINEGTDCITITNILLGDVWLCSGQSNMALRMLSLTEAFPEEISEAHNDFIRHFLIPEKYSFDGPQADYDAGSWEAVNPQSILNFTAAGYFFAKNLYEKYHVPIGIINASLGGSPAEAWLSEEAILQFPEYQESANNAKDKNYVDKVLKENQETYEEWHRRINQKDKGLAEGQKPFYAVDYDTSGWKSIRIPCFWEDEGLGYLNGVVWFRKEVEIPADLIGSPAKIIFGQVIDEDTIYINGTEVGSIPFQYAPRRYKIPEGVLKAGKNIIAIRVVNVSGDGGFYQGKPYQLKIGDQVIDLSGEWQYRIGCQSEPIPAAILIPWQPSGLYNAMLAPIIGYSIKGAVWYQGETNAQKPENYEKLLRVLIADWRLKWNMEDCPFLLVQLPNFMEPLHSPAAKKWAAIREAQRRVLAVPGTAMTVNIDIGERYDVHPANKKELGYRLALAALKTVYGEKNVVAFGPMFQSAKRDGKRMVIAFSDTGSGLVTKDGNKPGHFGIAGADKKYVPADTAIEGNCVAVWNDQISDPCYVRYAWADDPAGANLCNKEGLPASPFTTE